MPQFLYSKLESGYALSSKFFHVTPIECDLVIQVPTINYYYWLIIITTFHLSYHSATINIKNKVNMLADNIQWLDYVIAQHSALLFGTLLWRNASPSLFCSDMVQLYLKASWHTHFHLNNLKEKQNSMEMHRRVEHCVAAGCGNV